MSKESSSNMDEEISNPFIFEELKTPIGKRSINDKINTFLLVNTKPWANKHLPYPNDYKFKPCLLRKGFERLANDYRTFKVKSDDVWVLGYPKSGTTWMVNIVSQLKNGLDLSEESLVLNASLFLEQYSVDDDNIEADYELIELFNTTSSPRLIKSHLPPHLLPVELWTVRPKIIYIARNPKDVAISFFHMITDGFRWFSGSIEEYFDIFLDNRNIYAPFHDHVHANWQLRNLDNFLFLNYEEQLADQFVAIEKIATFLECSYGKDKLKQLMEYTSIGNMQKLYNFAGYAEAMNGFQ